MKRNVLVILPFVFLLYLTACPPPDPNNPASKYQIGYTTLNIARTIVTHANSAFLEHEIELHKKCQTVVCDKLFPAKTSKEHKQCMYADHSAVPEFKTCYGNMAIAKPIINKTVPLLLVVFDGAKASLDFAVQYETAKGAAAAAKDPEKLKAFCTVAFPNTSSTEYQDCVAGKPLAKADWFALLKSGCCIAYTSLAFMPEDYAKYVDPIRSWAKTIGNCQ
jgi:hypothetical protein